MVRHSCIVRMFTWDDSCNNITLIICNLTRNKNIIEVNRLFNVTINDISVMYVTAHRCAGGLKKDVGPTVGSQRHRHFVHVGFFNVPVEATTRDQPFFIRLIRETAPFSRLLRHAGTRWTHSRLTPPGPHGGNKNIINSRLWYVFTVTPGETRICIQIPPYIWQIETLYNILQSGHAFISITITI